MALLTISCVEYGGTPKVSNNNFDNSFLYLSSNSTK